MTVSTVSSPPPRPPWIRLSAWLGAALVVIAAVVVGVVRPVIPHRPRMPLRSQLSVQPFPPSRLPPWLRPIGTPVIFS
jgi:hypothetical protein